MATTLLPPWVLSSDWVRVVPLGWMYRGWRCRGGGAESAGGVGEEVHLVWMSESR